MPRRPAKAGFKGISVAAIKNSATKPKIALVSSGSVISFRLGRSKLRCKNKITIAQYNTIGLAGFTNATIPKTTTVAMVARRAVLHP